MKIIGYIILLSLLLVSLVHADTSGHINLLAVSSDGQNETGSVADLFLEIKPGSGRVFIDTFPLTKLDTQLSTRFAKTVACNYLDFDCSNQDFFYTIRAQSSIIGGPSAGAAITLLTISLLSEKPLPENIAVTGTINSGGFIGPVGGVVEKVKAADKKGLNQVLVPKIFIGNSSNLSDVINETNIRVDKVSNIDEALYALIGQEYEVTKDIEVDPVFSETMKKISDKLCADTKLLFINTTNSSDENKAIKLYGLGKNATSEGIYYSGASYCFGANVIFRTIRLNNLSQSELYGEAQNISNKIDGLNMIIDNAKTGTLSDLQAFVIVKERLTDANTYILELKKTNYSNISSANLGYSIERYNSALSWANFFGTGKREYIINKDVLKRVCNDKISQVINLQQYVNLYLPVPLNGIQNEIDLANEESLNGNYELCIFKAGKANALLSMILESISISEDQMSILVDEKFKLTEKTISDLVKKDVFPILGYSYYEYANSLRESDTSSSLLYISYANEFSNLNIYFEQEKSVNLRKINPSLISIFFIGFSFGAIFAMLIMILFSKTKNSRKNR